MKNKKTVVIGGGTGLSTLLRGLKLYTNKITAVVTVADDGVVPYGSVKLVNFAKYSFVSFVSISC